MVTHRQPSPGYLSELAKHTSSVYDAVSRPSLRSSAAINYLKQCDVTLTVQGNGSLKVSGKLIDFQETDSKMYLSIVKSKPGFLNLLRGKTEVIEISIDKDSDYEIKINNNVDRVVSANHRYNLSIVPPPGDVDLLEELNMMNFELPDNDNMPTSEVAPIAESKQLGPEQFNRPHVRQYIRSLAMPVVEGKVESTAKPESDRAAARAQRRQARQERRAAERREGQAAHMQDSSRSHKPG